MAQIIEVDGETWLDEHRTCERKARKVIKVKASQTGDLGHDLAQRCSAIGELMDDLAGGDEDIAIVGSAWSQSDLFASPAVRIDTALDTAIWELPPSAIVPERSSDHGRMVFVTGGAKLHEVMEHLDAKGASFRTAGSHKGQSVAGAIATGTHGSLIDEAGLEVHVRGLLFVNGTGASHWIADPSRPVLTDGFIGGFAQPVDPAHFHDALLHLGGLGYCAGVLLEGVDRFGLSWVKACASLPAGWWDKVQCADFSGATAHLTPDEDPAFIELTFDPSRGLEYDVMQTVYWRDALPDEQAVPEDHRDSLDILADRLCDVPRDVEVPEIDGPDGFGAGIRLLDIPEMIFDDFRASIAEKPRSTAPASLMALTGTWEPRSVLGIRIDTFNAAFAVPLERLKDVMQIGSAVAAKHRKHFVYTVRFASKSPASLSFLRFERSAIINIDGLTRAGIAGWISHSDEAARAFTDALDEAGVDYSMHWGKDIPASASKIARDFGPAVARYRALRETLLSQELRSRLKSPMLEHWSLA